MRHTSSASFLPKGYHIDDIYTIKKVIGTGGSAVVYWVTDKNNKNCLLKEIFPQELAKQGKIFRNENGSIGFTADAKTEYQAYINTLISAASITQDAGKQTDDPTKANPYFFDTELYYPNNDYTKAPYLLMRTEGGDMLNNLLKERDCDGTIRKFPLLADVLQVIKRMLEAVEPIHAAGYLHGDLSPDNFHVSNLKQDNDESRRTIRAIDFGSAFPLANKKMRTLSYKHAYAPVELMVDSQNSKINFSSDLYSIAAILFEMLYNEPFIMYRHIDNSGILSTLDSPYFINQNNSVKKAVRELLTRALCHPRIQTCEDFEDDIDSLLYGMRKYPPLFTSTPLGKNAQKPSKEPSKPSSQQAAIHEIDNKFESGSSLVISAHPETAIGEDSIAYQYACAYHHKHLNNRVLIIPCTDSLESAFASDVTLPIFECDSKRLAFTEGKLAYAHEKLEYLLACHHPNDLLIFERLSDNFSETLVFLETMQNPPIESQKNAFCGKVLITKPAEIEKDVQLKLDFDALSDLQKKMLRAMTLLPWTGINWHFLKKLCGATSPAPMQELINAKIVTQNPIDPNIIALEPALSNKLRNALTANMDNCKFFLENLKKESISMLSDAEIESRRTVHIPISEDLYTLADICYSVSMTLTETNGEAFKFHQATSAILEHFSDYERLFCLWESFHAKCNKSGDTSSALHSQIIEQLAKTYTACSDMQKCDPHDLYPLQESVIHYNEFAVACQSTEDEFIIFSQNEFRKTAYADNAPPNDENSSGTTSAPSECGQVDDNENDSFDYGSWDSTDHKPFLKHFDN